MKEEVQNLNSNNKSYKKWLIVGLIVIIIVLMFLIARFFAEAYVLNKSRQTIDSSLFSTIRLRQYSFVSYENISTLAEAQSIIFRNRDYVQNQINDLKTNSKMEIFISNRTVICADGRRIPPEDIFNHTDCFYYNSSMLRSEGEGNIKITVNGAKSILIIVASSQMISLNDYIYYGLEQNQKNPKNGEDASARVLDTLNYLSKKIVTWQTFVRIFREFNDSTNLTDAKEVIIKTDSFARNLELPTEQEIDNSPIKDSCINLFNSVVKPSNNAFDLSLKSSVLERVFFLGRSVNKICGYLEKYQKENAKKILRSLEKEQNPLVIIDNKVYLNMLTKCGSEWFYYSSTSGSNTHECQDNYLKDIESRLSAAVK